MVRAKFSVVCLHGVGDPRVEQVQSTSSTAPTLTMPPKTKASSSNDAEDDLNERMNQLRLENDQLKRENQQLREQADRVVTGLCLFPSGCNRGNNGGPSKAVAAGNWKFGPMSRCSYHGGGYRCIRGREDINQCIAARGRQWKGRGGYAPDGLPAVANGPDTYCKKCTDKYGEDELEDLELDDTDTDL